MLLAKLTKVNSHKIDNVRLVHEKKLAALGYTEWGKLDADKVIFNYSDRILTDEEKDTLKLDLQFGFQKDKVN